ncbi:MAG: 4Fe-4S dicluster domain-containing protein [Anaerolineae bacterium]|nr:4Fe-4S dicluster domain-containing protein [Anaerolineae bacterium]
MPKWSMVIDLDKCVACQGCSIACRFENNTPIVPPSEAALGRSILWNEVFPLRHEEEGAIASDQAKFLTRPCMHCENPPCVKVCPVEATYQDEEGIVRQNYARCIGCRFCTVGCPYGVRYFNWYEPSWEEGLDQHLNPDRVSGRGDLEGPAVRPKGVVEKCTYCIHRLHKAHDRAEAEGRAFRAEDYVPACVQTCTGKARFFGDLDDPNSSVSQLAQSRRAFRLLEEAGTHPKTIYLHEG